MRHTDSIYLYRHRRHSRDSNKTHSHIAKAFRSARAASTEEIERPKFPQFSHQALFPGQLDVETARRFVYNKHGRLIPFSHDRRHTTPSVSLVSHESPRRFRFTSIQSGVSQVFSRVRKSKDMTHERANSGNTTSSQPQHSPSTSSNTGRKDTRGIGEVCSEEYHVTKQGKGRRHRIYRSQSVRAGDGTGETVETFTEMNQKTAPNQKVFCSWGDGVDVTIPGDNLSKYVPAPDVVFGPENKKRWSFPRWGRKSGKARSGSL